MAHWQRRYTQLFRPGRQTEASTNVQLMVMLEIKLVVNALNAEDHQAVAQRVAQAAAAGLDDHNRTAPDKAVDVKMGYEAAKEWKLPPAGSAVRADGSTGPLEVS